MDIHGGTHHGKVGGIGLSIIIFHKSKLEYLRQKNSVTYNMEKMIFLE